MSEAPHESPVKTPGQLIAVIIASFAIPIILIVLFANYANHAFRAGAGTDALSDEQVAARVAPLAKVDVKDANAPRTYKTGEEVYKAVCVTCHGTAPPAPKFGNKDDWAPRISQGFDTLLKTALAGRARCRARHGPDDVSDYEIARAIVYMANNDGANFGRAGRQRGATRQRRSRVGHGGRRQRANRRGWPRSPRSRRPVKRPRQQPAPTPARRCTRRPAGLPRGGRARRAEVRQQGRLGAAPEGLDGHGLQLRAARQGRDAAEGRVERVGRRREGRRRLHGQRGEVTRASAMPDNPAESARAIGIWSTMPDSPPARGISPFERRDVSSANLTSRLTPIEDRSARQVPHTMQCAA